MAFGSSNLIRLVGFADFHQMSFPNDERDRFVCGVKEGNEVYKERREEMAGSVFGPSNNRTLLVRPSRARRGGTLLERKRSGSVFGPSNNQKSLVRPNRAQKQ
jgi:hypothetical protein